VDLCLCALIYGAGAALLLANRHALIYPFQAGPTWALAPGERIAQLGGMPQLDVWLSDPQEGAPVILYFLGNGGRLADARSRMRFMADQGFGFAVMTYRGSAGQPGTPSEAGILADADRLDAELSELMGEPIPSQRRVFWGTSLGAAVATAQASARQEPPAGLVIEAGFTRLCDAAQAAYPIFPACWLMWDERYDTAARLPGLKAPVLLLHGQRDQVIPFEHAEANAEIRPDAVFKVYPDGAHSDLTRHGALEDILRFIDDL